MMPRALLVDDSLTVRMDLAEALREGGFEVQLASSVAEARALLAQGLPDLAVLDVVLPDGDGIELLAQLRATVDGTTPVVLLSTEAEVADRIRGLRHGANEYVGKPYDADYVVARARELVRSVRPTEEVGSALVLIVDDSATFRHELRVALETAGYRVVSANSGSEGLRKAALLRPDALVVDGSMPDLTGTEVIQRVRSDPGLDATPCLLLTGSELPSGEIAALDAGADRYVQKDEGFDVLLARLSAMLRASSGSRDRTYVSSSLGPRRVLTVDASPTYLEELREAQRLDGYEVVKATSGEQALELLAVERFDCVLMDLGLPGMSGTAACAVIKGSPELRAVPIIVLSSRDEKTAMIEVINVGADDYVVKSANFDVIRARVRAQLRRRQFEEETRRVHDELVRREADAAAARHVAEARRELLDELSRKNEALEHSLTELSRLNHELESFAYSVSHDLRQPLRGMDGFSKVLLEQYASSLDEKGAHYLRRIRAGAQRMGALIDGLLILSRVTRSPLSKRVVRLDEHVRDILQRLHDGQPERRVEAIVDDTPTAWADPHLIESLLENLLGNAWKFTAQTEPARIHFGCLSSDEAPVYFVSDNGAGFDPAYADKLFGVFQRLHGSDRFEGTGIGLATAQRIVHRHGGRIWAEGAPEKGASFFFELPGEAA